MYTQTERYPKPCLLFQLAKFNKVHRLTDTHTHTKTDRFSLLGLLREPKTDLKFFFGSVFSSFLTECVSI